MSLKMIGNQNKTKKGFPDFTRENLFDIINNKMLRIIFCLLQPICEHLRMPPSME